MWEAVYFAAAVTLPNALLLVFGHLLGRFGQLSAQTSAQIAKLVFNFSLPLMLFTQLSKSRPAYMQQLGVIVAGAATVLLLFAGAEIYAYFKIGRQEDRGVFVQGVFRGNLGVAGLSLVQNAYGSEGVAAGAVLMGAITVLFNILAVITLSRTAGGSLSGRLKQTVLRIFTNPLILAIVSALLLQSAGIRLPEPLMQTAGYVAQTAVPLALICAGAAFNPQSLLQLSGLSQLASFGRLVLAPCIGTAAALVAGLNPLLTGVLFIMIGTPATPSGYVMAKAMGANDQMAADIVGITTFAGMFTAAAGIALMRGLGLM